jgi:hypothetical protein
MVDHDSSFAIAVAAPIGFFHPYRRNFSMESTLNVPNHIPLNFRRIFQSNLATPSHDVADVVDRLEGRVEPKKESPGSATGAKVSIIHR